MVLSADAVAWVILGVVGALALISVIAFSADIAVKIRRSSRRERESKELSPRKKRRNRHARNDVDSLYYTPGSPSRTRNRSTSLVASKTAAMELSQSDSIRHCQYPQDYLVYADKIAKELLSSSSDWASNCVRALMASDDRQEKNEELSLQVKSSRTYDTYVLVPLLQAWLSVDHSYMLRTLYSTTRTQQVSTVKELYDNSLLTNPKPGGRAGILASGVKCFCPMSLPIIATLHESLMIRLACIKIQHNLNIQVIPLVNGVIVREASRSGCSGIQTILNEIQKWLEESSSNKGRATTTPIWSYSRSGDLSRLKWGSWTAETVNEATFLDTAMYLSNTHPWAHEREGTPRSNVCVSDIGFAESCRTPVECASPQMKLRSQVSKLLEAASTDVAMYSDSDNEP